MSAAAESLLRPRPQPLMPFIVVSLVGHLLFIGSALVLSWALAGPRIDFDQKPIKASLVRLGKKRDEKLLPRKEVPLPPPPAKAAPVLPTPEAAKPTAPSKPSPVAKPDTRKNLFDAMNKTAVKTPDEVEGEADGDPDGDSAVQEGERYFGLLKSAVRRNYDVSNTIPELERIRLKAEVAMRLGTTGELLDVTLTKSSGNDLFDDAVLSAVKKAAPFGPPPDHLRGPLKSDGVALVFTP